jgi:hypothetical protein
VTKADPRRSGHTSAGWDIIGAIDVLARLYGMACDARDFLTNAYLNGDISCLWDKVLVLIARSSEVPAHCALRTARDGAA